MLTAQFSHRRQPRNRSRNRRVLSGERRRKSVQHRHCRSGRGLPSSLRQVSKADLRHQGRHPLEEVTAAVDQIIEQAGTLSGMVVNAGITNHKAALDFTKEEIERLFSINVSIICEMGIVRDWKEKANDWVGFSCLVLSIVLVSPRGHSSSLVLRDLLSSPPRWPPTDPTSVFHPLHTVPARLVSEICKTSMLTESDLNPTNAVWQDTHSRLRMGQARHPRQLCQPRSR